MDLPLGTVIALPDGRRAVIRFSGVTEFAPGDWIGVRLDEPTGKNDGAVQGVRYFTCEPSHGMFIRPTAVAAVLEDPGITPKTSSGQLSSSSRLGLPSSNGAKRIGMPKPSSSSSRTTPEESSSSNAKDASDGDSSLSVGGAKRLTRSRASLTSPTRPSGAVSANALSKEAEDLRTKLKVLGKKRAEDREKLKDVENLQADKNKFESIITKLQAKYQPQALELSNLRKAMHVMEAKLEEAERLQAEHDSILEMATLDREMAEETAEAIKVEFEALKLKAEELELEVEVLREENKELSSGMTQEEKSSAGWLQLEKTNERLREALIRLRDMTQQQELDLKKQVQELEADLEEYATVKADYEATKEQLRVSEANLEDLKQQVEALGAEDMIEELTERNMQYQEQMTELKAVIEDLESLRELNDELELNHTETEKQMQEEIDYLERLQQEQRRKVVQQDETIADLEHTLTRFRDLVRMLQSDLEDMRVTQQLTETEANDLTMRSRAMIDLNMKLQSSIAKAQTKTIDMELNRMEAEESEQHLEIMKLYLPESYETEKNPILAFLRFKRISFKASLMHSTVKDRMADTSTPLSSQEIIRSFDVLERLTLLSSLCKKFINFISNCSGEEFLQFEGAWYELEPIERNLNQYIDGLRKNELHEETSSIELQRSTALVLHLSETLLPASTQIHADDICIRSMMIQTYLDSTASMLTHLKTVIAKRLPGIETEAHGPFLLQKLDGLAASARGGKVVAGRTTRTLEELKARLLTPPKECAEPFEQTEDICRALAELCRSLCTQTVDFMEDAERAQPPTPEEVIDCMNRALPPEASASGEAIAHIGKQNQIISTHLEELSTISTDLSQTVEFEQQEPPWVTRSQEIKSTQIVPPDADEEIRRLRNAMHEAGTALGVKDQSIEEQAIKIDLLESRMKDSTKKAEMLKQVQAELEKLRADRDELEKITQKQSNDLNLLEQEREDYRSRLEKAKRISMSTDGLTSAGAIPVSEVASIELLRENDHLRTEVASLQAAVRYTREESRRANLLDPYAVQRITNLRSWLDAPLVRRTQKTAEEEAQQAAVNECHDVFSHLQLLVSKSSLVDLRETLPCDAANRLAWRPLRTTTRYHAVKQRDEYEAWASWKEDVARRERERARRAEAIREARRRKEQSAEPPTLYQVYSNAFSSGAAAVAADQKPGAGDAAHGVMDKAMKLLGRIHRKESLDGVASVVSGPISIVGA
ncbi:hypothetical protein KEM52_004487 [Ascosphaera acerosa]|nr:hypothetical protein KEM52_004487 [Ascosphaera acerosa]